MKKTKQKILDTSRVLFNKLGYSQVTIRMIAMELKMSSGNLNYHFKKREDILEALYFEMVEVFDNRVRNLEQEKLSLSKMKIDIKDSMHRMVDYKFFWTDLYNLLSLNEKIRQHFEKVLQARIKGYHYLFSIFMNDKILKVPSFENEYSLLIERMISFSNTWLYASSLYEKNEINEAFIDRQTIVLMSILYPYLTAKGKRQFNQINPTLLP